MAVGFVALAFVTGGASILATGATAAAGSVTVAGVTFAAGLGTALFGMAAASLLSGISQQLFSPKIPETQLSRLNITINPTASRKAVFGTTALNSDLAYHETSGTNQEYVDYIIVCAAHKVTAISEIWFDDKKAWDSSTGVTSTYNGYLTVYTRTEGTSGNTIAINGGAKWGSSRRLTGCAYVYLRIKRSGNDKKTESPLVSGLPSRITIRGNGALLYDPRKDSTVTGGSGSHRTNDQTTWGVYTDADDCDNPALQLLWWLLGWKINGVLSVGCGVPAERIDLESFITAANVCDENITLAGGGTQKRYRTSGTASDSDDRRDIINSLLACMNGTLRDNEGKLTVTAIKNDLANYTLSFDDDDILGEFEWNQTRGLTETYNVARGRYVDPSDNSLYQMIDYPEVRITSVDGIERVATVDLPYVEDGKRAQRIAKQVLQRNQYRGMFTATFTAKAMGCQVGDVVRITFTPLGWTNKLFRVVSQQIDFTGRVPLSMIEENAAIYAWDAEESAPVTPTAPTVYNPLNNPFILGIEEASTAYQIESSVVQVVDNTGSYTPASVTFSSYVREGVSPRAAYAGRMVVATSADGVTYTDRYTSASDESSYAFTVPTGVGTIKFIRVRLYQAGGTTNLLEQIGVGVVVNGTAGADGITISLTNISAQVFAYADGSVPSFSGIDGQLKVFAGGTDVTASATLATSNTNVTGTINTATNTPVSGQPKGYYRVTAMSANTGYMTFSVTYNSVVYTARFSVAKLLTGYEIVGALPSSNLFEGRMVFLTTDDKLYRYDGSAWTKAVDGADLVANSVTTNAINAGAVTAAKIAVTQLDALSATIGTLRTASTGARMEIKDNVIKVYDGSNVLRVQIGNLSL